MRVLFCGDKHLKISRFDLATRFLSWLNKTIEEQRPDLYVALGDDMDTHAVVRSELLSELRYHFDYVLSLGIPVVYVVGNHDCFKPNDIKYHALKSMVGLHKDLHVIDSVTDLYGMTFVPYTHDPIKFPTKTREICVAHQTFKGADYGDIITKDGVDALSLQEATLVISGHIHKRQILDTGRVRVLYPGSPFSQSASDIDQVKGVSLIETDTHQEKFIPCPLPMWKNMSFELGGDLSIDVIHEQLLARLNDIDSWVIEIKGPKTEITSYIGSLKYKNIIKNKNVKLKTIFTDKAKKQIRLNERTVESVIDKYIDSVYSGSLDKAQLKLRAKALQSIDLTLV